MNVGDEAYYQAPFQEDLMKIVVVQKLRDVRDDRETWHKCRGLMPRTLPFWLSSSQFRDRCYPICKRAYKST